MRGACLTQQVTIKILHKKSPHCPDLKHCEQGTHKGYVLGRTASLCNSFCADNDSGADANLLFRTAIRVYFYTFCAMTVAISVSR